MRSSHILAALLILVGLIILLGGVVPLTVGSNPGIESFFLFLVFWGILLVVSPVMMLLARARILVAYHSFIYTLLFVLNIGLGVFVILQVIRGGVEKSAGLALLFAGVNVLWACILVLGICRPKYGVRGIVENGVNSADADK